MELPTLDLSKYTAGNETTREEFGLELLSSLTQHGFVKLRSHGISSKEVSNLWQLNKIFFQLPAEEKAKIAHEPGPNPQRGWSRVGAENSSRLYRKGLLKSDMKDDLKDAREHFDMGPRDDYEYPNKWLEGGQLSGFRPAMEHAFQNLERISANVMEALEVAFKLPHGTFLDKITHEKNACEFRLNHYPEIDVKELKSGVVSRVWPHFDLGVITLLFQDSVGGLEFENRKVPGTFHPINFDTTPDLIVNVSETLQRWTNDRLPAGLHRVDLPQHVKENQDGIVPERYSIAYFCKANREASVGSLKQFVPEGTKPIYKEMLAIDYQMERLLSAY